MFPLELKERGGGGGGRLEQGEPLLLFYYAVLFAISGFCTIRLLLVSKDLLTHFRIGQK
jgi:hypothetical protein